jgi:hypothetical protein
VQRWFLARGVRDFFGDVRDDQDADDPDKITADRHPAMERIKSCLLANSRTTAANLTSNVAGNSVT